MRRDRILVLVLMILASLLIVTAAMGTMPFTPPAVPTEPAGAESPVRRESAPTTSAERQPQVAQPVPHSPLAVRIVADNLDTPWALAFAPDGRLFVAERPGRVRVVRDGRLIARPLITLPVRETAEGGIMGLAVDPEFPSEPYLFSMYTYTAEGGLYNRVVRLRVEEDSAEIDKVLLDEIPAANTHNGGRVKIGPDGLLYVSTGDAGLPEAAQDLGSLAGKILRLQRDGSIPSDNPFPGSPVYSLGHRNPQGLAWQPGTGHLYATEHGAEGNDEVNLIESGGNYGWPRVQGTEHTGYKAPVALYSRALAPAGATFITGDAIPQWQGAFIFATLQGGHLRLLRPDSAQALRTDGSERLYEGAHGRLRDVVQGPDGALYVTTSNRDGRGSPTAADDRILRIGPVDGKPLLHPDLETLTPSGLHLGRETIDGVSHRVLRFTNMVRNVGKGPLELAQVAEDANVVHQSIYDQDGMRSQRLAGEFVYHETHDHWHFEEFALYELWTREAFERWLASGRSSGEPGWRSSKNSSCLMDNLRLHDSPESPAEAVYPDRCERRVQGLSVGWADIYTYDLPEQWLDLGEEPLPDGRYVLRSVVDYANLIEESEGGRDASRESPEANEALAAFVFSDGRIVIESPPG